MKLVFIFGPPAVGKMTVGRSLSRLTGYPLFHNHMTIELLLQFFPFGSESFARLNRLFREELFAEISANRTPGLIFTYVWALDQASDKREVDGLIESFGAAPQDVCFVELFASQAVRRDRNVQADRLAEKPSKRDTAWSDAHLVQADGQYKLSSGPDAPFPYPDRHIRIDNAAVSADAAASTILGHFSLPRRG